MNTYRAGIDVGSTTVKLVVTDENLNILYGEYRRHCADIQPALCALLEDAARQLGGCALRLKITGSGSINLGKALGLGFVQEVAAVAAALRLTAPQTDVAIELGGEDAKIIYFTGGLDERMNGICAGGTGAFIDQMAALLQTDAAGLDCAAAEYKRIYPIAARCGVFAKTDIQPLINEGATKADLAASIFQAVVNQTISGLAASRYAAAWRFWAGRCIFCRSCGRLLSARSASRRKTSSSRKTPIFLPLSARRTPPETQSRCG